MSSIVRAGIIQLPVAPATPDAQPVATPVDDASGATTPPAAASQSALAPGASLVVPAAGFGTTHVSPAAAGTSPVLPEASPQRTAGASVQRTAGTHVAAALSSIADTIEPAIAAAVASLPRATQAAARALITQRGPSPDVLHCVALVGERAAHLTAAQTEWVLRFLTPNSDVSLPPEEPSTLSRCIELLALGGPRVVRQAFHAVVIANLGHAETVADAMRSLDGCSSADVARLSLYVPSQHPLRRHLSKVLQERLAAAQNAVRDSNLPLIEKRLAAAVAGDSVDAPRPLQPSTEPAATLADRFVAHGQRLLAPVTAKLEALTSLQLSAPPTRQQEDARSALEYDIESSLRSILESLVASRPFGDDVATALATTVPIGSTDAYARRTMLDHLAHVIRLTRGEVLRVLDAVNECTPDARPELLTRLSRAKDIPLEPRFPLHATDGFVGSAVVHPLEIAELMHESGHAYECARPDVLRAALAFRDAQRVGPNRSLNDLSVVYELAAGDGALQRRLLERIATNAGPLDSIAAVEAAFAGCGIDLAIAALANRDWRHLRPYDPREIAVPLVGHPYLGKVESAGTTEVVSLGLEALSTPALMLAALRRSSDHVAFILGAIEVG